MVVDWLEQVGWNLFHLCLPQRAKVNMMAVHCLMRRREMVFSYQEKKIIYSSNTYICLSISYYTVLLSVDWSTCVYLFCSIEQPDSRNGWSLQGVPSSLRVFTCLNPTAGFLLDSLLCWLT